MSTDDDAHTAGRAVTSRELAVFERARELADHDAAVLVGTAVALLLFPFLLIDGLGMVAEMIDVRIGGYEGLPALVLVYGIVVIGFNLLLGYTGLLSFGHAAFFGTAAYAAGIFSSQVSGSPLLMVLAGTVVATLLAWPIGVLSIRRSGVYFAVLTLTFGQMLYFYALGPGAWLTNGDNGFSSVEVGDLFGMIRMGGEVPILGMIGIRTWEYVFIAAFTLLTVAVVNRIINSPYGLIFEALGENEQRVSFVGLDVFRYKLMAFVLSAMFAGIGGSLFVMHEAYIHPTTALYWITSGDFVIMTVLGGTGSLVGPVFGAFVFEYISNVLSGVSLPLIGSIGSLWRLILGAVFVVVVWTLPRGIYGALVDLVGWLARAIEFVVWAARNPREAARLVRERAVAKKDATVAWLKAIPARIRRAFARFGIGGS